MLIDGEQIYENYQAKLLAQGVSSDGWEDLEATDQAAWQGLADDMYMHRESAVVIAKEAAALYPQNWPYLSEAKADPTWMPHEWVIQAILRAANGEFEA